MNAKCSDVGGPLALELLEARLKEPSFLSESDKTSHGDVSLTRSLMLLNILQHLRAAGTKYAAETQLPPNLKENTILDSATAKQL